MRHGKLRESAPPSAADWRSAATGNRSAGTGLPFTILVGPGSLRARNEPHQLPLCEEPRHWTNRHIVKTRRTRSCALCAAERANTLPAAALLPPAPSASADRSAKTKTLRLLRAILGKGDRVAAHSLARVFFSPEHEAASSRTGHQNPCGISSRGCVSVRRWVGAPVSCQCDEVG